MTTLTRRRDESFNSITGLNGSGKSNILDAICFVLGITNMTTVRAQNLQVWLWQILCANRDTDLQRRISSISADKQASLKQASRLFSTTGTRRSRPLASKNMRASASLARSCSAARQNTSSMATERSNKRFRTSFNRSSSTSTTRTSSSCRGASPRFST